MEAFKFIAQSRPDQVSQVHLVRHGEVYNPEGVLYGRAPGFHLSDNGQAMAQRLGEWFSGAPLAQLRSSPLERAQQTIAPIAQAHPDLTVRLDERLLEAENHLAGQVFGKHNRALFNPKNFRYYLNPMRPSWGEPYHVLALRMLKVLREVAADLNPGEQAVMVSHQLPIWTLRRTVEGRRLAHNPSSRQCTLGSVTTFRCVDGEPIGVTYAEPARDLLRDKASRAFSSGS